MPQRTLDLDDTELTVYYERTPYTPATRHDPEEGGECYGLEAYLEGRQYTLTPQEKRRIYEILDSELE